MSNTANASDDRVEAKVLFKNLQANLPELEHLFAKCSGPWNYEDLIYRFYHKSLKVYSLQDQTLEIVSKLQALV
jgi:hypothetical protein